MKISVIGTGYVGLVAGVCFAESGHKVVCVDIDEEKVARLRQGEVPIYEPGLSDLLLNSIKREQISFTTSLAEGIQGSEIVFIAVGTPSDEDGRADLRFVLQVAKEIGQAMDGYKVIVDKSTVPVGTADKVRDMIATQTDHSFDVVSNPEFLKEGAAIQDFLQPDRIVIGANSKKAEELMLKLYDPFVRTGAPIYTMDVRSAEMTKYISNAMLATKISFINEMARVCDAVGADINIVRKAVGADKRIGSSFLFPGVGFGGSCFPKDVRAISKTGIENDLPMHIMKAVNAVNDEQKKYMCDKIAGAYGGTLVDRQFGVWGLSFKPKTDDMREAPSLVVIEFLLQRGARVKAYDPQAMEVCEKFCLGDRIEYAKSRQEAAEGADALVLLTEWTEFRTPDFSDLKQSMSGNRIFDGRNIYSREEVESAGFEYFGIGC